MMTDRKDAGAEVGLKSSDLIGPRSFYHNRKDAGENGFREIKWAEHRWNTRIGIFFNTVYPGQLKFLGFYMKILRNQVGCSARSSGRSGGTT